MNGGLCEGYPTEDILGKWARRVADRQTLWTKCLLFWMHVLDMVGLASHSLSAKGLLFMSALVRLKALIAVLFVDLVRLKSRGSLEVLATCKVYTCFVQ